MIKKSDFAKRKYLFLATISFIIMMLVVNTQDAFTLATNYTDPGSYPISWPATLNSTTTLGVNMADIDTTGGQQDNSNGGTTPNGSPDFSGTTTNAASFFSGDGSTLFIRYRLNGNPTALTGASEPYDSETWNFLMDVTGDGFWDFAVSVWGIDSNPEPDDIIVRYNPQSPTKSQRFDASGVQTLWKQDSAKHTTTPNNTDGELGGSADWTWTCGITPTPTFCRNFARTRVSSVPGSSSDYYLDIQVPVVALDASTYGGPVVSATTKFSFGASTSNSNANPLQKDFLYNGTFNACATCPFPTSDVLDPSGNTYTIPAITSMTAGTCPTQPITLTAQTLDSLTLNASGFVVDTIDTVRFEYYYDRNGNNLADDSGSSWTFIANGTTPAPSASNTSIGLFSTTWNTSTLPVGNYLIKSIVTDDPPTSNVVDSYDQSNPGRVISFLNNTCGATPDGGDAPNTYGTNIASNGALHYNVATSLKIGTNNTDTETPTSSGTGTQDDTTSTDDEDSINTSTIPTLYNNSTSYSLNIPTTNSTGTAANLRAWIDFNRDGVFDDNEASDLPSTNVPNGTNGNITLNWSTIPAGISAGSSYIRLRITTESLGVADDIGSKTGGEVEDYPITINNVDYGDAPDSYGTLEASNGAKHATTGTSTNIFLGTNATDSENNGIPNISANGDDSSSTDDEDSVSTFPSINITSTSYSLSVRVTNNTGNPANLRGWIDFNRNNAFDSGESVTTASPIPTGTTGGTATLNWTGLSGLVAGQSYIRLRFTTDSLANTEPTGTKSNGEVEDYPLTIDGVDYGDAPDNYGTLSTSSGARHVITGSSNIFLGTTATDQESNGTPSTNADGDDSTTAPSVDDEDSVTTFPSINTTSTSYSLSVRVTNNTGSPANLRGWIDFNRNNAFDSGESVTTASPIPTGTTGGTATLNWTGLSGLVAGQSYIRLRFTTDSLANTEPTGTKSNGEVEDYPLTILGPKNISGTVFEDVNYGGGAGRNLTTSSGVVRPNATVELYSVSSGIATYITSTTTNASGVYTFSNRSPGDYLVRVVNETVSSSRTGYVNTLRSVQTFRTDVSSGSPVDVTNYVGGQNPTLVDPSIASSGATLNSTTGVFTAGLTGTAQSITNVALAGTNDISGIDFGYNFDTIVNTNSSGQGSLLQFIINSNTLDNTGLSQVGQTSGREVSIFMIPNGVANAGHNTTYANQLNTYGAATININSFSVTAPNTSIDGRTQTNNVKQSNGQETNPSQSGTGGFVGVSQTRLNSFDNPEVEIVGSNNRDNYNTTTTATGFELRNVALVYQGILVSGNNSLVQDNFISIRADGNDTSTVSIPNVTYSAYYCLEFGSGSSNMIARHNYVKCNNSGIRRDGSGSQMLVEYNEVDRPSTGHTNTFEAFLIIGAGNNDTAQYNLFKNQRGAGSELGYNANAQVFNLNIRENTYTGNGKNLDGTPSAEPLGIIVRTIGSNSVVNISKNIIGNNGATGILVQNTNRVKISQNSIFGNGPTGSLFGTTANLGIDLRTGDIDPNSMGTNINGVTPNNGNIASTEANNGTDYPIITSSVINGTTIKIQGYVGIAPNDTDFANSILEFFIADDDGNNNGAIISGDGQNVPHGEGKIYVDTCNTNLTDGSFNCTFYNVRNVTPGMFLTATATNQNNDTSEFSNLTIVQEEPFLFYPDNTRNAIPSETIVYPHELVSSESGNIVLNAISNQGWTYTFFRDVNGNSILDSGDTAYSGGMSPSLGNVYNLYPSHSVKILVKLFIPSNIAVGTVDSLVTTATLTPTAIGVAPKSLSVIDVTTVSNQNSGSLQLLKSVSPSGSQPPGANLTYTIAFTNTGAVALHDIVISDQVPANTKFVSAGFISGTTGTITAPAVNTVGRIDWSITGSLAPGATGSVTFIVKIDN